MWEWAASTRDLNSYFTADDLLQDLRSEFMQRGKEFPKGAEDHIRKQFDFRVPYEEMQRQKQEDQLVADMLGSGQVMQSITDQVIEDLNRPEIMGIDISEYSTQKESVVPPEVRKFIKQETGIRGRIRGLFKRIFGR